MFENKAIDAILDRLPKKYWNNFSRLLAFFTLRTIGSPIRFSYRDFTLQEYDLRNEDASFVNTFLDFCYPADEIPDREKEIEIDKGYWPSTKSYIITQNAGNKIAGCIQVVEKTEDIQLPMEYSRVVEKVTIDSKIGTIPKGKISEIYRCRKASDLSGKDSVVVISMLFKAIWATVVNSSMEYSVLTFDAKNHRLFNMYTRKLDFKDTGIDIQYGASSKTWKVLLRTWKDQEENYASISKAHFYLQTWYRFNLKNRRLRVSEPHQHLLKPEDIVYFEVTGAKQKTAQSDSSEFTYNTLSRSHNISN